MFVRRIVTLALVLAVTFGPAQPVAVLPTAPAVVRVGVKRSGS